MFKFYIISLLLIPSYSAALNSVDNIDLNRYLGKWYEIARIDSWFERGCINVTAEYNIAKNNVINVTNSCYKGNPKVFKQATGRAWVVDSTTNAKLKVSFLPSSLKFLDPVIAGDYWILKIDPNYKVALVGEPSMKYLWVLARTPQIDERLYNEYLGYAESQGYNISEVHKTIQEQ